MRNQTKLPPKLIGLIACAILFESVFWLTIHNLNDGAKKDAEQATAARKLADKIESASSRAKDILSKNADVLQSPTQSLNTRNYAKLENDFADIKQIVNGDGRKEAIVKTAHSNAIEHIEAAKSLRKSPTLDQTASRQLDPSWVQIQNHELTVVSEDFKKLGAEEREKSEKLSESQIQKQHDINNIQLFCLCFKAFTLLLLVCLFATKLTDRLNWIAALLVVQLVAFAAVLLNLEKQSEVEITRNVRALKTVNAIKEINSYFVDINATILQNALSRARTTHENALQGERYHALFPDSELDLIGRFMDKRHLLGFHFESLKQLLKDEPEQLASLTKSKEAADNTFSMMESMYSQLEKQIHAARVDDIDHSPQRRAIWSQIEADIKEILSVDLLSILSEETELTVRSPNQQEWLRQQINNVLLAEVAIILACLSVIAFTLRSVTKRVNVMSDNALRLATDKPLNPPVKGDDEISHLDNVFHSMAQAVKEATQKEKAILANASDVICSIGNTGHFSAVNPAALPVFGYTEEEMFGKLFVEFISKEDAHSLVDSLDKLKKGIEIEPIEVRMVRKDGNIIDTFWSATWSSEEKSIFCVIHDITERKEAERMKQEVVAMITHDLRTPLSTIRNFHEMLSTGLLGELTEKAERMLILAERNSSRMLNLINDLLDVEKIKAGMMELNRENLDVFQMLETVAQSLSGLAKESEISIVCIGDKRSAKNTENESDMTFFADDDKLSRVLTNLVSNAIKFSPKQSTIYLNAEPVDNQIQISVRDEGRGIPQEKLAGVFDRFQQVSAQDHVKSGGSGLGLTICKAIVDLHGGAISVESTEGKGTTFKFTIPTRAEG